MTTTKWLVKTLIETIKIPQHFNSIEYDVMWWKTVERVIDTWQREKYMIEYVKTRIKWIQSDEKWNLFLITPWTPLFCCHLDNVWSHESQHHLNNVEMNNGVLSSGFNIWGDDKCGVAIAIQLFKKYGDKFSYLFTVDEEIWSHGVKHFIQHHRDELESLTFCVIGDRRWKNDVIWTKNWYCSQEFLSRIQPLMNQHNFINTSWLVSDGDHLCDHINTVNVSVWYYEPHTDREHINVGDFIDSYKFIESLMLSWIERLKPNEQPKRSPSSFIDYWYSTVTWFEPMFVDDGVLYVIEPITLVSQGWQTINLNVGEYDVYWNQTNWLMNNDFSDDVDEPDDDDEFEMNNGFWYSYRHRFYS